MSTLLSIILPLAGGIVIGAVLGFLIRWIIARKRLSAAETQAREVLEDARREAEAKKKEAILEGKDELLKERNTLEKESRERWSELQRMERRLLQKEENLEKRGDTLSEQERGIATRERAAAEAEEAVRREADRIAAELERVSGLSRAEAKKQLIQGLENEARHDAQVTLNLIEQEARLAADKKARDIIVTTIQRLATDVASEATVTTVSLPNDEMKGRIIGREGRNIRTLETLTGVDIIIDDTPEAVVISCFDPIRREIAKMSLSRLISDGRIHPARIEEIVQKVSKEIAQTIYEEGEKVLFEVGIHGMGPEAIRTLGRLHFRTSYGQNVLAHSKEVALIAGMIASEVGANADIAKRAALLHDIGKGVEADGDGSHIDVGLDLARRLGEDPRVVNAIGAHHGDIAPEGPEAVIVQIADAISAARPGARKETLDNYLKRLENLESIAEDFDGVDKAYAIQAGRELRILVNNEKVSDDAAKEIAKGIAKRIEGELKYPGRIKVTIIRETRVVEYAR